MRFPLPLACKFAAYILGHKIRGTKKFATVLQLEPLHTCNLSCTGCGRIREYSTSLKDIMPLQDCLDAAEECGAPMVSICGGEPLIYPHIEALVQGLLKQRRIVYICTNATVMRRKMRDYLSAEASVHPAKVGKLLKQLLAENLISQEEASAIGSQASKTSDPVIGPHRRLYWNVHLDGLENTHDLVVERSGVFKECILAIRMAKLLGYQVATNTTVYTETNMTEIELLFEHLSELGVDGHTISPGYEYDSAKKEISRRSDPSTAEEFFLTRKAIVAKFERIEEWGRRFPLLGTPLYLEFLAGKRDLTCAAWAIPTRNVRGWKGPCYLITDGHYNSYAELLEKIPWDNYGVLEGVAKDVRCENCMVHCGYEPGATLGLNAQPGDTWKNIRFNFGPDPKLKSGTRKNAALNGKQQVNGKQPKTADADTPGKNGS